MKTAAALLSIVSLASLIRYGLVVILIGIGLLKFTRGEAEAIRPLAENSPFFSWAFSIFSTRIFSGLTGAVEVTMGILIALRGPFPLLSALGSVGAVVIFSIVLTFMLSSPMYLDKGLTLPFIPYSPWQFLIVHLALLGASVWTAYEAFAANRAG